jgi:hypothetical protein
MDLGFLVHLSYDLYAHADEVDALLSLYRVGF